MSVTLNICPIVSFSQVGTSRCAGRGTAFFTGVGLGAASSAVRFAGGGTGVGATFALGGGVRTTGGVLGPAEPAAGEGLGELEIVPWSLASRFRRIYIIRTIRSFFKLYSPTLTRSASS